MIILVEYCDHVQDEVTFELEHHKVQHCKGTKPFFVCDHMDCCSIATNYCPKFRKLLNLEPIDDDTF